MIASHDNQIFHTRMFFTAFLLIETFAQKMVPRSLAFFTEHYFPLLKGDCKSLVKTIVNTACKHSVTDITTPSGILYLREAMRNMF